MLAWKLCLPAAAGGWDPANWELLPLPSCPGIQMGSGDVTYWEPRMNAG